MKPWKIFFLVLLYGLFVGVLFKGIKAFEIFAKAGYYHYVSKKLVAEKSLVPPDKCILGIYKPELPYSFDMLKGMETELNQKFNLVSFYQAWGSEPEHQFQPVLMDNISKHGRVPVVTWEPWVSGFKTEALKPMPEREHRYLQDVAAGTYDFYIDEWAREAVRWGKPFFLRFAHEMTNQQYPWSDLHDNTNEDYIRAWWHVWKRFESLGAKNVIWVWCPYRPADLNYYPGDKYVDWVAIDVFNYGELLLQKNSRWMSFDHLTSPMYREISPLNKPIMIAETASSDMGGSREVWYKEMLEQIPEKFPLVKALVLFENPSDGTSGSFNIDWSVVASEEVMTVLKRKFDSRGESLNNYYTYIADFETKLSIQTE